MVDTREDCWYSIHRIVWLECMVEIREWLGPLHQIHRPISMVRLSFLVHNLPVLPFYPLNVPQPHHQNELKTNQNESINFSFQPFTRFQKTTVIQLGNRFQTIWKRKTCSLHSWKHATIEVNISNTIWHRMRYSTGLAVQSKAVNVLNASCGVMSGHNMSRTLLPLWHAVRLKRDQHMNKRKFNEFKTQTKFLVLINFFFHF